MLGLRHCGSLKSTWTMNEYVSSISSGSSALAPLPRDIAQYERQRVVFALGSRRVATPYATRTQTTRVLLASHHVENAAELEPVVQRGNDLTFGPYDEVGADAADDDGGVADGQADDTAGTSSAPLRIHFENHAPAITYTSIVRDVRVPHPDGVSFYRWLHWLHWLHWLGAMPSSSGRDIEVSTRSVLLHSGARLIGGFSRLEYQQEVQRRAVQAGYTSGGGAAIHHVSEQLPDGAHSVTYRDAVGNVSSSVVVTEEGTASGDIADGYHVVNGSALRITLRYPLFGGWRAPYETKFFVAPKKDGPSRGATMRVCHAWFGVPVRQAATDRFTLRVVLPEGARSPRLAPGALPFALDAVAVETQPAKRGSVLSALGIAPQPMQTVLVLTKENVVWEHYRGISIEYELGGGVGGGVWAMADWVSSAAVFPLLVGVALWSLSS